MFAKVGLMEHSSCVKIGRRGGWGVYEVDGQANAFFCLGVYVGFAVKSRNSNESSVYTHVVFLFDAPFPVT